MFAYNTQHGYLRSWMHYADQVQCETMCESRAFRKLCVMRLLGMEC